MADLIIFVLLCTAFLGCAVFTVRYFLWSEWQSSPFGRNLMAFMAVSCFLIVLAVVRRVIGDLPDWILIAGFLSLNFVVWWRVALLRQTQRKAREQPGDDGAAS